MTRMAGHIEHVFAPDGTCQQLDLESNRCNERLAACELPLSVERPLLAFAGPARLDPR